MGAAASTAANLQEDNVETQKQLIVEARTFLQTHPGKFAMLYSAMTKAKAEELVTSKEGSKETAILKEEVPLSAPFPSINDGVSMISLQIAEEVTLLRSNPAGYAQYVEAFLNNFIEDTDAYTVDDTPDLRIMTTEGRSAVIEAIEELKRTAPLPGGGVIQAHSLLGKAAADHVQDMANTPGLRGHAGSNGSTSSERIQRYGQFQVTCGENIDYGMTGARNIVVHLLIDDGVPSRGHRKNLLEPQFKCLGAAFGSHTEYRCSCVIDFAGGIMSFDEIVREDTTETCVADLSQKAIKIIHTFGGDNEEEIINKCLESLGEGKQVALRYFHEKGKCELEFSNSKGKQTMTYQWGSK